MKTQFHQSQHDGAFSWISFITPSSSLPNSAFFMCFKTVIVVSSLTHPHFASLRGFMERKPLQVSCGCCDAADDGCWCGEMWEMRRPTVTKCGSLFLTACACWQTPPINPMTTWLMPLLTLGADSHCFPSFSDLHHPQMYHLDILQCTAWCDTVRGVRRDVEQCCATKSNKLWGCAELCGTLRGAACFLWMLVGTKAVAGWWGNVVSAGAANWAGFVLSATSLAHWHTICPELCSGS